MHIAVARYCTIYILLVICTSLMPAKAQHGCTSMPSLPFCHFSPQSVSGEPLFSLFEINGKDSATQERALPLIKIWSSGQAVVTETITKSKVISVLVTKVETATIANITSHFSDMKFDSLPVRYAVLVLVRRVV